MFIPSPIYLSSAVFSSVLMVHGSHYNIINHLLSARISLHFNCLERYHSKGGVVKVHYEVKF